VTNFLYCFDSNYNVQATVSISTLLEKYDSEVNLYILHDNPRLFKKYKTKLKKYKNLNKIEIYKFEDTNYDFPNLNNSHVSYATYFRMFISNYLPQDIDFLIYLDADILCLSNPRFVLDEEINKLKNSDNVLTGLNEEVSTLHKQRLGLKNNRYFNAGLIIINYQKWSKPETIENFLNIMNSKFANIEFWDQDILNIYFDGKFSNLPINLNYISPDGKALYEKQINFLHFAGSNKPWYFENTFKEISKYYNREYMKVFRNKYHVTFKFKKHEIPIFIDICKTKNVKFSDKVRMVYGILKTKMYH
tara:strand:+ start:24934 stop:25845 length:912 start_codon:yes stop_codon:yes gene_type:complete